MVGGWLLGCCWLLVCWLVFGHGSLIVCWLSAVQGVGWLLVVFVIGWWLGWSLGCGNGL